MSRAKQFALRFTPGARGVVVVRMLTFCRLSTMTERRNPLTFRCAVPDDEVFLFELYGSTRKEEMAAWGWTGHRSRCS